MSPKPLPTFQVVSPQLAQTLPRSGSPRFELRFPLRWQSPVPQNPHAQEAESEVVAWLWSLGCSAAEIGKVRRFDTAGYVGVPFPLANRSATVRLGKYLALWLLWDDVHVESLESNWKFDDAEQVLAGRPPEGMSRFDLGWWQLLSEFRGRRSPSWIRRVCHSMSAWSQAAQEEAQLMRRWKQEGLPPTFQEQMELRIATIGMYGTIYLLEDADDGELPTAFHQHPRVMTLKRLSNQIVGLGNDIFSFGKDCAEGQINLISTLQHQHRLSEEEALAQIIHLHNQAVEEYDRLAATLDTADADLNARIHRWVRDVRYASVGFTRWESQAPRYTAHQLVFRGELVEPTLRFLPAPAPSRQ